MRRLASRGRKRPVRATIRVEFLEDRQLLNATAYPTNSLYDQSAIPMSLGQTVTPVTDLPSSSSLGTLNPLTGGGSSGPYTPAQLRHAYGVDQLTNLNGAGQTIAIVDAYSDPSITSDLTDFDNEFGLPAANLVIAQPETSEGPMTADSGWDLEISLDVEWAHAIAPGAKILLVEAYSSSDSDLLNAVTYAASQGATQISMSWGGSEFSGESSINSYFQSPGVTYLASSGDSGGALEFPAISPYVTSVGGTSLTLTSSNTRATETAWSAGGGGVSAYITEPSYQEGFQSTGKRTTPDVAYDADPNTGVYVYYGGSLDEVGGTSVGAPQWAGLIALANEGLANAGKSSLGSGQTYGTNNILYQLAGGTSYTNPNGDFYDVTSGSSGNNAAGVGYDEATGLGTPNANKLIPDLIGPTSATPPTIGDAGFEQEQVGSGNYLYNPTGSAWTFTGNAGLAANNSGFTIANPPAPQGTQVAFLQKTGEVSQSVAGWAAGSYSISFDAAQRANGGGSEDFEVLVDGTVVSTFKPTGTSYQAYTTASFTVAAGAHTIEFLGLDTAGGDNTALLDAVSVATATPPAPPANSTPTIGDAGFEQEQVGSGNYLYNPTGSAWTFTGNAGLAANNSGFTIANPPAPQGTQVAFLQKTGEVSQSVAGWAAGSYSISFDAAQRANGGGSEDFEVLVDGTVVSTFKPTGTSYQAYTTASFTVAAGAHTIEFLGLDTAGGDNTALLDAVSVATATPPAPPTTPTIGDAGFEQDQVGSGNFAYDPTGSAWTFTGSSGISANNSAFTGGNPNAPQGTQVALIQKTGEISQSVAGWAAGSYTIAFDAAQRADYGTSVEDFEVLIDGTVVSTFKPTGTSYQAYTTASFTVTAGAHTIEFLGLDTAGGDNTAFLDNVTVATA